jgi:hypothetical protein
MNSMEPKMTKKEKIEKLHDLARAFCKKYLNKELSVYVGRLIEMVLKSNKYDVDRGKIEILAAAIVHIIAKLNLLYDAENKYHISIDNICDYYGVKKRTVETKAKKIESICKIMVGHEGLCGEEISDALTFLQFENGTIISKAMAKEHGII